MSMIPSSELTIKRENVLGRSSTGDIFYGLAFGKPVAVKILSRRLETSVAWEELQSEVDAQLGLEHENIVSLVGVCLNPASIITEYCPDGSLYDFLETHRNTGEGGFQATIQKLFRKKFGWEEKVKMVLGIAKGLQFLHTRDTLIIHQDLKSTNIMLRSDRTPVITDFGMASGRALRLNDNLNPTWIAPEVVLSKEQGCAKGDIYSFAIIMWEILTGDKPWSGLHPMAIVQELISQQRPKIPREVHADCVGVADYVNLMEKCWQEDKHQRPDCEEVVEKLVGILGEVQDSKSGSWIGGTSGGRSEGNDDSTDATTMDGSGEDGLLQRLRHSISRSSSA